MTTNDAILNQIFIDYNVSIYEQVNIGTSYERFELLCDCDALVLKQELDTIDTIILSTDYLFMAFLLSIDENTLNETEIYPNPFENKVVIKTNSQLVSIDLFDILGKQVIKTNSKSDFESLAPLLIQGVYILKITDIDYKSITRKLIKQ
ncbi:T9SS type A sorting domain-containing protein [Psychroserpens sp.]